MAAALGEISGEERPALGRGKVISSAAEEMHHYMVEN